MTPAEWNSSGAWGRMTPEMNADIHRLAQFVAEVPLAALNPAAVQIESSDAQVRGWGVAGSDGGLFWVQDFALEGQPIEIVRQDATVRQDVQVEIRGMASGTYAILPYDTWQGVYLEAVDVNCTEGQACPIALPDFTADIAFRVERK
jgi:hypothetical protein